MLILFLIKIKLKKKKRKKLLYWLPEYFSLSNGVAI